MLCWPKKEEKTTNCRHGNVGEGGKWFIKYTHVVCILWSLTAQLLHKYIYGVEFMMQEKIYNESKNHSVSS